MNTYIFRSERLGFRTWKTSDHIPMSEINFDKDVMAFFPDTQSKKETREFIKRMGKHYREKGYCYFAVDMLKNREFIGFIGLSPQDFDVDFTPCVDIGWRLKKSIWNQGFATEGAIACLDFAFRHLNLDKINALAPVANVKSVAIMKKIGMKEVKIFNHPKLINNERLRECVLYEILNPHQGRLK